MSELDRETEALMWKIRALLMIRARYKNKQCNIKDIAEEWHISERESYRHLAEADLLFRQLQALVKMQPDFNKETNEPLAENMHTN
jgi:hypothetical protein